MLEGEQVTHKTQQHLDRCLTCKSCETTCPSGVKYGHLVELARPRVDQLVKRGVGARMLRWLIRQIVPYPRRFTLLLTLGQLSKPFLPQRLAGLVPSITANGFKSSTTHERTMLLHEGCAQAVVAPSINQAARAIFDRLDVSLDSPPRVGCCGAVNLHLGDKAGAIKVAKTNIDQWLTRVGSGAEGLLVASSGCAVMIQDYPSFFSDDDPYLLAAKKIAVLVKEPSEALTPEALKEKFPGPPKHQKVAFQVPCSMQHATHAQDHVKDCLRALGYELSPIAGEHLCCGSAGSYSLLQPDRSEERRVGKECRSRWSGEPKK